MKVIQQFQPDIIERKCGGFLATTPDGYSLQVGVISDTRKGAEKKLREAVARSYEMLEAAKKESKLCV